VLKPKNSQNPTADVAAFNVGCKIISKTKGQRLTGSISAWQAWRGVLISLVCMWLLFGSWLEQGSISYARTNAYYYAQEQVALNLHNKQALPSKAGIANKRLSSAQVLAEFQATATLSDKVQSNNNLLRSNLSATNNFFSSSTTPDVYDPPLDKLATHLFIGGVSNTGAVGVQVAGPPDPYWAKAGQLPSDGFDGVITQLAYGPNQTILAKTDGGSLWRSSDGKHWTQSYSPGSLRSQYPNWADGSAKLTQIVTIGDGTTILAAVNTTVFGGFPPPSGIAGSLPGMNGYYPNNGVYRSDDGGQTFTQIFSIGGGYQYCGYNQMNVTAIAVSPVDTNKVWIVGEPIGGNCYVPKGVYISSNGGRNFPNYSQVIPTNAPAKLYADPVVSDQVYAIVNEPNNARILKITGNNPNPSVFAPYSNAYYTYSPMVVDPNTSSTAWVANGGLHKTINGGQTWTDIPINFGSISLGPTTIVRGIDGTLYAGTEAPNQVVIASSSDGGTTWVNQTGNMAEIPGLGVDTSSPPNKITLLGAIAILPIGDRSTADPNNLLGCNTCNSVPSTQFVPVGSPVEPFGVQSVNPNTGNLGASGGGLGAGSLPPEANALGGNGLAFGYTYNSLASATNGPLGQGWRHSYQWDLAQDSTTGVVTITQPSGRRDLYSKIPNTNQYNTPSNTDSRLTKDLSTGTFGLMALNQTIYNFGADGKIINIRDRNQNGLNFSYNGNNLSSVSLCLSNCNPGVAVQSLNLTYSGNRISSVSDGSGRSMNFGYDSTNPQLLTTITDELGRTANLTYYGASKQYRLQTITAGNGQQGTMNISYAISGKVTQVADGLNQPIQLDYRFSGATVVTNARSFTSTYYYDSSYRTLRVVDANLANTLYSYDARGHLTQVLDARGFATYLSYDSAGLGLPVLVTKTVTTTSGKQVYKSQVDYNAQNQPTTITDTRGFATQITYDSSGNNPTQVRDPLNNTTTYSYGTAGAPGRVTKSVTSNGLTSDYIYDGRGYPNRVTQTFNTLKLPNATALQQVSYATDYTYDVLGRLIQQSDTYDTAAPPNPILNLSYEYDAVGHLLTTTNQLSQKSYSSYNLVGKLSSSTTFQGQQTNYSYDGNSRLQTTTQIMSSASGGNLVTTYAYDGAGNLSSVTDPRQVTSSYEYDPVNRLSITHIPLVAPSPYYLYVAELKTQNTYDLTGNLLSSITYNADVNGTSYYFLDELGRPGQIVKAGLEPTLYEYDPAGNVTFSSQLKRVDLSIAGGFYDPPTAITSSVTYDALNRPTARTRNAWTEASGSKLLTTQYNYNAVQNLQITTDPYGIATMVQHDPLGRVISTTVTPGPNGGPASPQTSYNYYNPNSLLVRSIDAALNWNDTAYDPLHRANRSTQYTGGSGTGTPLTTNTYYSDAPRPQITTLGPAPYYSRQDTQMDEAGRTIQSIRYTGAGNSDPTVIPNGALTTSFGYDGQGNQTVMTDTNGYVTRYAYENTGWLVGVTQTVTVPGTGGAAPTLQTLVTKYDNDLFGNRARTTDANNHLIYATYDWLHRLQEVFYADNTIDYYDIKLAHYTYDGTSRLVKVLEGYVDPDGQGRRLYLQVGGVQTDYTYDNADRMLTVASKSSDSDQRTVERLPLAHFITTTYAYNDGGQRISMRDQVADTSQDTTTNYTYDKLNRPTSVTSPQGVVRYSYDNLNRRTQLQFGPDTNNLKAVGYSYDGLSRPTNQSNWLSEVITYNYTGPRLTRLDYPATNGVQANYSYDGADRLIAISQLKGASPVFTANYTLDSRGNRTAISENVSGTLRTLSYKYDELSRLLTETQQSGTAQAVTSGYLYDKASNRTSLTTQFGGPNTKAGSSPFTMQTTYSYNNRDYLVSKAMQPVAGSTGAAVTTNYTYNVHGNLIQETNSNYAEQSIYTYNSRKRLINLRRQARQGYDYRDLSSASFSYDGDNTRTYLSYNSTSTSYLQDTAAGFPVVLQETISSNPASVNSFFYPASSLLGATTPLYQQSGSGSAGLWYHSDAVGSVRALTTGSTGATISAESYSAFGLKAGEQGKAASSHQFAGEQLDPTGLYYNRARYYNPSSGRFIGRDSVEGEATNPVSLNHYTYGWNNPIMQTDPGGNFPGGIVGGLIFLCALGPVAAIICGVGGGIAIGVGGLCLAGVLTNNFNTLCPLAGLLPPPTRQPPPPAVTPSGECPPSPVPVPVPTAGTIISTPAAPPGSDSKCGDTYRLSIAFAQAKNGKALLAMEQVVSRDCMIPLQKNSRSQMPAIANHIQDAQNGVYPMLLHYDKDVGNARRRSVCYNKTSTFVSGPPPNTSCDEYPYASTGEGGINPVWGNASTRGVPLQQQRIQGQVLDRFYTSAKFYNRYNPSDTSFAAIVVETGLY